MSAILQITFLGPAEVDDLIGFDYIIGTAGVEVFTVPFVFKTTRSVAGEITIGTDAVTQAENFEAAFIADWIGTGYFEITRDFQIVTITNITGGEILEPYIVGDTTFAEFDVVSSSIDNAIHIINMTPRVYVQPSILSRDYLVTEDDYFILTEDNKKIRM